MPVRVRLFRSWMWSGSSAHGKEVSQVFIVRKCAAVLGIVGRDAQGEVITGMIIRQKSCKNSAEVETLRECWGEISVEFQPEPTKYYSENRA